jgi:4-diphosphocytidyl-2C-methyl-D-erythritol kinase
MANRLQPAACSLYAGMEQWRTALSGVGLCGAWMTGSGSSWFGVARSARHARRVAGWLTAQNLGHVVATATCT